MDIDNKNPDIYIVSIGDSALSYSFNLANSLREKDLIVLTETIGRSLKSQMKDANRLNASHVIIIGDDEIKSQMASIDYNIKDNISCLKLSFHFMININLLSEH